MASRSNFSPGIFKCTWATDWLTFLLAFGVASIGLGLMHVAPQRPIIALAPFVALASATLLWRVPAFPIFVLLLMTTMIEIYPLGFPDATTEYLGLWNNLSTLGVGGIPISPAEFLMIGGIGVWLVRGLFSQTLNIYSSDLIRPYAWYLLVVAAALTHGLLTGGVFSIALWEIRSQVYGIIVFFLLLNTLHSRKHFEIASWIMVLGTGLKGVQGSYRYLVTLRGNFSGDNILEHDEGFFFPAYYVFTLLLFIFGGTRRQKQTALALLPFVIISDFANKRRASTGSLMIAAIVLMFILFTILKEHRLRILCYTFIIGVVIFAYAGAFWNSNSKIAQPVRAIKSAITPEPRDASSDLYRKQEDFNLMWAVRADPLFGRGYGVAMSNVSGMYDMRERDPFLLYRPHNSILWVWWRTGIIGAMLFWIAMGSAIIRHSFIARAASDHYLRRWAVFSVTVTIMFLMLSWWDMGQFRYRAVIYTWIILAIVEVLWRQSKSGPSTSRQIGVSL